MPDKITTMQKAPSLLELVPSESLFENINLLHNAIARRAFEIFEANGGIIGRDLDHWFRAEAELLHPVPLNFSESDDTITIEAEVPGFSADELRVSVEPRRLTISGKKQTGGENKKAKLTLLERRSDEILRIVELPVEVNAPKSSATLKDGIVEITMPKAAQSIAKVLEVKAAVA